MISSNCYLIDSRMSAGLQKEVDSFFTHLRKNWFIVAIMISFALGLLIPEGSAVINPQGKVKPYLVYGLLFLAGLSIPSERIIEDLKEFRLHLFIQGFIFLVFPLLTWLLLLPLKAFIHPGIAAGILALSCLPSTVSSCIFFTQVSGGNVTAAVFNVAVSNMAGIILTPLLFSLLVPSGRAAMQALSPGDLYFSLARTILIPIAAGQLVRLLFRSAILRYKSAIGIISNLIIFLLIYFAVSNSAAVIISTASFALFALPIAILVLINLTFLIILYYSGLFFRFDEPNRLTALFVGSHKTLALGLPLTAAVFGADSPDYVFIILPLIFYYNIQLVSSGIIRTHIAPRLFSCSDLP